MSYHYIDAKREADPYVLANVETFYVGTTKDWKDPLDCYLCSDWSADEQTSHSEHIGWHYAYGTPGCLWDSDPVGPFETEEEALTAAREAAGFCEHGISEEEVCEECPAPELWALQGSFGLPWSTSSGLIPKEGEKLAKTMDKAAVFNNREAAILEKNRRDLSSDYIPVKLSDADARRWGRDSE